MTTARSRVYHIRTRRSRHRAVQSLGLVLFECVNAALVEPEIRADPVVAQWAIRNVVLVSFPHFDVPSHRLLLLVKGMWAEMVDSEHQNDPDNNNNVASV